MSLWDCIKGIREAVNEAKKTCDCCGEELNAAEVKQGCKCFPCMKGNCENCGEAVKEVVDPKVAVAAYLKTAKAKHQKAKESIQEGTLPNRVEVPTGAVDEDTVADYLSDTYGWCVTSLDIEKVGDKYFAKNIVWDTSESVGGEWAEEEEKLEQKSEMEWETYLWKEDVRTLKGILDDILHGSKFEASPRQLEILRTVIRRKELGERKVEEKKVPTCPHCGNQPSGATDMPESDDFVKSANGWHCGACGAESKKPNYKEPREAEESEIEEKAPQVNPEKEALRQKAREADIIIDNDRVMIVLPKSYEAMKKYGMGSRWDPASGRGGRQYFDQYYHDRGWNMYIVIDKAGDVIRIDDPRTNRPNDVAKEDDQVFRANDKRKQDFQFPSSLIVAVYPDGKRMVYDSADRLVKEEEFGQILDDLGIMSDVFTPKEAGVDQTVQAEETPMDEEPQPTEESVNEQGTTTVEPATKPDTTTSPDKTDMPWLPKPGIHPKPKARLTPEQEQDLALFLKARGKA